MTEKRHATQVAFFLGTSIVLMLFLYVLVAHHREMPDRVQQQRGALMSNGAAAVDRIKPVGQVEVAAAQIQPPAVPIAAAAAPAIRNGQQVYQASCVACHGTGVAGAPKVGDKGRWTQSLAKGLDVMYANAVNGVQGNTGTMPAKGGNPALSNAEVKAAVDYMVAQSK